jgi:two-component system, LuxR family, response regulator DctR
MITATTDTQICIVDDDLEVLDSLSWLMRSRSLPCNVFSSGELFLDWLSQQPAITAYVRVILLDVRMGQTSGLQVFEQLRQFGLHQTMPVIFLTGHGDVPMAVEALKQGAFDFFEKPFNDNALLDRIEQALIQARQYMQGSRSSAQLKVRLGSLTDRERDVMALILDGKANKVVAEQLDISARTVEVHRSRVFEKLAVKSVVELAKLLSEQGLDKENSMKVSST